MAKGREGYNFSSSLKAERRAGTENKCENCGKYSSKLEGHHLIPVFLSKRNPVLIKSLVTSIINMQMCCPNCHREVDEVQRNWDSKEVGDIAWALFDLNSEEVVEGQGKAKKYKGHKKHKKKRRR